MKWWEIYNEVELPYAPSVIGTIALGDFIVRYNVIVLEFWGVRKL